MVRSRTTAHALLVSLLVAVSMAVTGGSAGAQSDPEPQAGHIAALLDQMGIAPSFASLGDDFLTHFLILAPDLAAEDREVLQEAVGRVFAADSMTQRVASALSERLTEEDVERLVETAQEGPLSTLRRRFPPGDAGAPLQNAGGDMASLDPERLQLMVGLVEARRASDLALTVDEALRHAALRLFQQLGGASQGFVPMSDEQLATAYRNRTIRLAVESMQRMETASDTLVEAAVSAYRAEEARRFSEASIEAVVDVIAATGEELTRELQVGAAPADPTPVETLDPASAPTCRVMVCGFLVQWDGPEPSGDNLAYGRPGDLEEYTYERLVGAGYRLVRGAVSDGFNIHLRARSQRARCEVVVGLNPRSCLAVGQVEVDFEGSYPGFEGTPFTVRNRCRATAVMAARGIASLVAARIHHELTTYPGDERREPRC